MRRPLVLCPLAIEAKACARFGKARALQIGRGADAVKQAFSQLTSTEQPNFIVLCGLANSLDPLLEPGAALLIDAACTTTIHDAPVLVPPPLRAQCRPSPATARIVESTSTALSLQETTALAAQTGARLVDMESYTFAKCATEASIPWAIVRGVTGGASDELATEVRSSTDAQGNTRISRVLTTLLRRPQLLPELLAFRRTRNHALRESAFLADALCCAHEATS